MSTSSGFMAATHKSNAQDLSLSLSWVGPWCLQTDWWPVVQQRKVNRVRDRYPSIEYRNEILKEKSISYTVNVMKPVIRNSQTHISPEVLTDASRTLIFSQSSKAPLVTAFTLQRDACSQLPMCGSLHPPPTLPSFFYHHIISFLSRNPLGFLINQ